MIIMNAGTFYELLDRLPERCDFFDVSFTFHDRSYAYWALRWWVDDNHNLILEHTFTDHGVGDGEGFTVYELKGILDGAWNYECECGQEVYSNMGVYGRKMDDDGTSVYYDILADRFEINWKRNRVDVFIDYSADLAD